MRQPSIISPSTRFYALDGLRGVAALIVIWYHIFEGFAPSPYGQLVNHGYLAVDFFFMLSGFVLAHAYDQWPGHLGVGAFIKRRIIRLHPLVLLASLWGAIAYILQGGVQWSGDPVGWGWVALATILHILMIPALPGSSVEVRGFGEMFPLNGPSWSLFFEYIGSFLYVLVLRRLSLRWLWTVAIFSGLGLLSSGVGNLSGFGNLGFGWSLGEWGFVGGMLRLSFAFSCGMLLRRTFRPFLRALRGSFVLCSIVLIALLATPYVGGEEMKWLNGLYDSVVILFVFPLIILLGASIDAPAPSPLLGEGGRKPSVGEQRLYAWLGEISYPLYIIHYPSMYLFFAWVWKGSLTFSQAYPVAIALFLGNIVLATLLSKLYDLPVRSLLSKAFLSSPKK